ncbi:hypothetical protein [Pseudomonas antarctica]|uniref:hypothetical protein n=1 Tax=Pseudomonas antarctica TaxID=219572 RepID=UPI001032FF2C|nr:hypothetical protein [Pseudomonas antarctica]
MRRVSTKPPQCHFRIASGNPDDGQYKFIETSLCDDELDVAAYFYSSLSHPCALRFFLAAIFSSFDDLPATGIWTPFAFHRVPSFPRSFPQQSVAQHVKQSHATLSI